MKTIVHAFVVVVLVLTGAAASTQTSASAQKKVMAARTNMLPVPTCPPDDPNTCGMGTTQ